MSMESDLRAYLLADAGVAAAVGAEGVYRMVAAQDAAKPYAVMVTLTVSPERVLNGRTGEAVARLQITCWGDTDTQADSARDAVKAALRTLEAAALRHPATIGSTRIRDVSDESDQELYEDDIRQPRRLLEFTVRYEE